MSQMIYVINQQKMWFFFSTEKVKEYILLL